MRLGSPKFPDITRPPLDKPWSSQQNRARKVIIVSSFLAQLWANDQGQDIAEYAILLAVVLVAVIGTILLIASKLRQM
jgi:Flp pilus assembly pilin Flp